MGKRQPKANVHSEGSNYTRLNGLTMALVAGDPEIVHAVKMAMKSLKRRTALDVYPNLREAVVLISRQRPDLVFVNVAQRPETALQCVRCLRSSMPNSPLIVLGSRGELGDVISAFQSGAVGYLVKPLCPAQYVTAIREVLKGGAPLSNQVARRLVTMFHQPFRSWGDKATLTPREQEIMLCLFQKHDDSEIAKRLGIGKGTVHTHLQRVFTKLGVHSRLAAVSKFVSR